MTKMGKGERKGGEDLYASYSSAPLSMREHPRTNYETKLLAHAEGCEEMAACRSFRMGGRERGRKGRKDGRNRTIMYKRKITGEREITFMINRRDYKEIR